MAENNFDELKTQFDEVKKRLDETNAKLSDISTKYDSLVAEKQKVEAERDTLKDRVDALEAENKELQAQKFDEEKIKAAVVLSAIGSVKNVRLNDIKSGAKLPITAARLIDHQIEGPLELLGLTGNIIPRGADALDCHLHIMASKASGDVAKARRR